MNRRSFLIGLLASTTLRPIDLITKFDPGLRFESYTSHFKWDAHSIVHDWTYITRITNIELDIKHDPKTTMESLVSPSTHMYA